MPSLARILCADLFHSVLTMGARLVLGYHIRKRKLNERKDFSFFR